MIRLVHQYEKNANSLQIANAIILRWQDIEQSLCPILGRRGVAALFKRSLHITSQTYPWLAGTYNGINFTLLKGTLDQQSSADVIAAGDALMQTFYELLTNLVGSSLTERLLISVSSNSFSDNPTEETPQ